MAELETLRAEPRAKLGKGPAYQTRLKGFIPGIVYGGKDAPQPVQVEERGFFKLYGTGHLLSTLFMLELEGRKTRVIPRAVQLDPVTDRPVHVDFMRLAAGARIALEIPVHFRGQENSPGIKRGGVLNIVRHTVEFHCLANAIPEFITIDLTGAEIGDSIHISSVKLPEGVRPVIADRDFMIANISAPTALKAEEEEEEEAAAARAAEAEGEETEEEGEESED